MTGALCAYFLADHLTDKPGNREPAENTATTCTTIARLTDFIPATTRYPPILDELRAIRV
ncbi:MAG: hypothetical protein ACRDTC_20540 [Pseudonocardiaceae bacterium]